MSSQKEISLVQMINSMMPKHPAQINEIYQSDAEMIPLIAGGYAFNIDDYSPEEDYFSDLFPERLGYNLVIATISDLLACGAEPELFLHAMTLAQGKDEQYLVKFCQGVANALKKSNSFLLGGDTSTASNWRYTAVAIGKYAKPIKRVGASVGDAIYISGKCGAGNRQALALMTLAQGLHKDYELASPVFNSRLMESKVIRKYATCMIDTSDGLVNSLLALAQVNADRKFIINMDRSLIEEASIQMSKMTMLPEEIFLFGSLGEYELLFCISSEDELKLLEEASQQGMTLFKVGQVVSGSGTFVKKENILVDVSSGLPDPRNLSPSEYINQLGQFIGKSFYV